MGNFTENTDGLVINGIHISNIGYLDLLAKIKSSIVNGTKSAIGYANANSINLTYKFPELSDTLKKFDIIHPDGIGIRIASSLLNRPLKNTGSFTGSDFYPMLIDEAIHHNFSFYFFGHDKNTLSRISDKYPELLIAGKHEGYNFNDDEMIAEINKTSADILVVGLGTPKQELWTAMNRNKLRCSVILCVGEGIKVFADSKKRGPAFLRKLGLEWLWRFLCNPVKYFGRYIIGNPLFLYRIIAIKMRKLAR